LEYSTLKAFAGRDRRLWERFTKKDKAFLQMILAEIPNFLVHASQQHPRSGVV
jgi:hypothetical protein